MAGVLVTLGPQPAFNRSERHGQTRCETRGQHGFERWSTAVVLAAGATSVGAQTNAVQWSASTKAATVRPGGSLAVEATAQMADGWHIYAVTQQPPPIATRITVPAGQPFELVGAVVAPAPKTAFDQSFGIKTEFYAVRATFGLTLKVAADAPAGRTMARVQAYFQACNDQFCLPPKPVTIEAPVEIAGAPLASEAAATSRLRRPSRARRRRRRGSRWQRHGR